MGEMADDTMRRAIEEESRLYDYCSGGMSLEEAYDNGFIDHTGCETVGIQSGWERYEIPTREYLESELEKNTLQLEVCSHGLHTETQKNVVLNAAGVRNLSKENPTCNCCEEEMTARMGKFGKFYYCMNNCPEQKTVSDKYWQSVRK